MHMISFSVSRGEADVIQEIARRAYAMNRNLQDMMTWTMDITACHANGMPLELTKLLAADKVDFAHDVFGIRRHIDRETGKLGDCFTPRYARKP